MNRNRTTMVTVSLAVTLALTALLATRAFYETRSHRRAAEFALRDYSAFAAAELDRRVRRAFDDAFLRGVLRRAQYVNVSSTSEKWPRPSVLTDTNPPIRGYDLRQSGLVRGYFLLHFGSGKLEVDGTVSSAEASIIAGQVREESVTLHGTGAYYGVVLGAPAAPASGFAYLIKSDAQYREIALYGVVFEIRALEPLFASALERPLLPRLSAGEPDGDALSSIVATDFGTVIFRSSGSFDERFAAERAVGMQLGALHVRVAADPRAVGLLGAGGLPEPNLPAVLAPVLLCALLLGAALVLLRRESELARMRNDFVANVSHELRTPLAQIRLFSETLLLGRVRSDAERVRSLEIVHQESTRLTSLVENLLHFTRPPGASEQRPGPTIDVAETVRDVVSSFVPLASGKGTSIRSELEEGLLVRVDRDAIRQILLNFLDNTLKYGPAGQVVTVWVHAVEGEVRIAVDDQGPGVPVDDRARIFERFARLSTTGSSTTGTGIGLAVVAELAAKHGGRAWVESALSGGARFVLGLPLVSAATPA